MTTYLNQHSYVTLRNGCPLRLNIRRGEFIEIVCGGSGDGSFEFFVEIEAFRELVELGTAALDQLDSPVSLGKSA